MLEALRKLIIRDSSPKPSHDPLNDVQVITRAMAETQDTIKALEAERLHRVEIVGTVGAETALGKADVWLDDIGEAQDSRLQEIDSALSRLQAALPRLQERLQQAQDTAKRHDLQQRQQQAEALKVRHQETLAAYRTKQADANEALTLLRQIEESIRTVGQQIFEREVELKLTPRGAGFASDDLLPQALQSIRRAWEAGSNGWPVEPDKVMPIIKAEVTSISTDPLPVGDADTYVCEGHTWSIVGLFARPLEMVHYTDPGVTYPSVKRRTPS